MKFLWLVFSFSMMACCWAQKPSLDPEQPILTQFVLTENSHIDQRMRDLLNNNVMLLHRPPQKVKLAERRVLRSSVRREIAGILATEGYFSPSIQLKTDPAEPAVVQVNIELGPPTIVTSVQIDFSDDAIPGDVQQSVQQQWSLPEGEQFRDEDWSRAKTKAVESLMEQSYAAARIDRSEALIHDEQADLSVSLNSGPAFHIGELRIQGLKSYQPWLLERYHPPRQGELYHRAKLLQFQRDLQNSPYFSSVTVSVDPDPELASAAPVDVIVKERQKHDVGLAMGYSSNTRARGEISYQNRDLYETAANLKSALRIEQLRQIGYLDIYLPPKSNGYLDSFGVLFNRSDISGLLTHTSSFGAKRILTENNVERRLGLAFVYEQSMVSGGVKTHTKALVASIGRTWRAVNNPFDPRRGYILQADVGVAAKAALSDQNFSRLYGKYQRWIPVGARDVVILRAEGGYVVARDDAGIPEDYLFRAGGTNSVRGYAYQSLGVDQDNGVVGGRILTTASAEYVHWFNDTWGAAAFIDVGDAADRFQDLTMKQGIGAGVRYKTPAGPIAVDVAYGLQVRKVRLDFSIGIAF